MYYASDVGFMDFLSLSSIISSIYFVCVWVDNETSLVGATSPFYLYSSQKKKCVLPCGVQRVLQRALVQAVRAHAPLHLGSSVNT